MRQDSAATETWEHCASPERVAGMAVTVAFFQ